jgi:DNA-binding GntR family transcriptional regulator
VPEQVAPRAVPWGTSSKTDYAYNEIRRRIVNREYPPKSRLVMAHLAHDLGVSVVPVREAVRRLDSEGLVVLHRNIGVEVAALDPMEWDAAMHVLSLLDGYATALATPHLTVDDVESARSINRAMGISLAEGDPMEFSRLNKEFHLTLIGRCPVHHLRVLVEREWDRLDAMRTSIFIAIPRRAAESVVEHERLLDLIVARSDPSEIEAFARDHKLRSRQAYLNPKERDGEGTTIS